jgi:hypothetical protein
MQALSVKVRLFIYPPLSFRIPEGANIHNFYCNGSPVASSGIGFIQVSFQINSQIQSSLTRREYAFTS